MRNVLAILFVLLCAVGSASAQLSIGIGLPGVSIGINLPVYPELVPVPGYPVYYAPRVNSNYFFYDGMYWVYQRDNWYASSWYNGPWGLVAPEVVPLFVLRVPVRYYRQPPAYFRGWRPDAPPRWGEHWGGEWEQHRGGWDHWDRRSVPPPAPLPAYQRQYTGNRYPRMEQQPVLHNQNYRYQPHDAVVQQHYQAQRVQSVPPSSAQGRQGVPEGRNASQENQRGSSRPSSNQQESPPASREQASQQRDGDVQRSPAAQAPPQQRGASAQHEMQQPPQGASQRPQDAPRSQGQDKGQQGQGHGKGDERGGGRNQ